MILEFLFFFFAATALVSALFVITRENPVASVMFLIVTLFNVAALFVLLDAHFLAAVQVIIYAGAIMVLFLFVVMLLNLGHARVSDLRGGFVRMLAASFGLALAAFTGLTVWGGELPVGADPGVVRGILEEQGAIGAIAYPLFEDYMIPFEVTGVLLLVAIIGAIVLARRQAP